MGSRLLSVLNVKVLIGDFNHEKALAVASFALQLLTLNFAKVRVQLYSAPRSDTPTLGPRTLPRLELGLSYHSAAPGHWTVTAAAVVVSAGSRNNTRI